MELINEEYSEPVYTIKFTKSELSTILVALGDTNFSCIIESAKSDYYPNDIRLSDSQNLYDKLIKLLQYHH